MSEYLISRRSHNVRTKKVLSLPKLKYRWVIGIDPGVNTGFAVWDVNEKRFNEISQKSIHKALFDVEGLTEWDCVADEYEKHLIRVEDARKRKWFGNQAGTHALQGAGSIKRDCKIWEDFLTDLKVNFEMVDPKNTKTKMSADYFKKITGWKGSTNEHSRDAALLCFGY